MVFSLILLAPSWGGMINGIMTLSGAWVMKLDDPELAVPAGAVRLRLDPYDLGSGSNDVYFTLTARDDQTLTVRQEARFVGPLR